MSKKLVVVANIVDEAGEIISSSQVSEKAIIAPTDISNFGYNKDELLKVMKNIQQVILDDQADFLKSEARRLP